MKIRGIKTKVKRVGAFLKKHSNLIFLFAAILFSYWLMSSAFGYENGELTIKDKSRSDFYSHIPMVRSFSEGENFPPEFPHFTGMPMRYHFLFYWIVGAMEGLGIRMDIAMNILSIAGMAGSLFAVFWLGKKLSGSYWVGVGASLIVIFNTSFSWLYYFFWGEGHLNSLGELLKTDKFFAFGPYNDTIISAFQTLNIYTSQRHLVVSFALMFLAYWLAVYKKGRKSFITAVIIFALMAWLNKATLMIMFLILGLMFLIHKKLQKRLALLMILGLLAAIPGLLYLNQPTGVDSPLFVWKPGYIYNDTPWKELPGFQPFEKWLIYWFLNFGLLSFFAFAGFLFLAMSEPVKKYRNKWELLFRKSFNERTVWYILGLILFVAANLFQLSVDMVNNHKLFNIVAYLWGIYALVFIRSVWNTFRPLSVILFFALIAGGICDFFPVLNDRSAPLLSATDNANAEWVRENTGPKDTFLVFHTNMLYIGAAGRKIHYGGAYYSWAMGYPVWERKKELEELKNSDFELSLLCPYLQENKISYISISPTEKKFLDFDYDTDSLVTKWGGGYVLQGGINIFKTEELCFSY